MTEPSKLDRVIAAFGIFAFGIFVGFAFTLWAVI